MRDGDNAYFYLSHSAVRRQLVKRAYVFGKFRAVCIKCVRYSDAVLRKASVAEQSGAELSRAYDDCLTASVYTERGFDCLAQFCNLVARLRLAGAAYCGKVLANLNLAEPER